MPASLSRMLLLVSCLGVLGSPVPVCAQSSPRDGQHDFDFEIGTWNTHLRRLLRPLTGSTTWVEYKGTTVVRKVWGGRANLVELDVEGPAGRLEGLSLRLYNPPVEPQFLQQQRGYPQSTLNRRVHGR